MSNDRIAGLETLFEKQSVELEGGEFTRKVMTRTRRIRNYTLVSVAVLIIAAVLGIWVFDIPVPGHVLRVSELLTTTMFDLGDSWMAWVLSPINHIGGLLLVSWKLLRVFHRLVMRTL